MQVKKLKQRDQVFDNALKIIDKKSLIDNVTTISDAISTHKILKSIPVARSVDFFQKLKLIWKDYDKIRERFMKILGKYVES